MAGRAPLRQEDQQAEGTPGAGDAGDMGVGARPGETADAGGLQSSQASLSNDSRGAAFGGQSAAQRVVGQPPAEGASTVGRGTGATQPGDVALLGPADEDRFRQRWADEQARIIDDRQEAVRTANGLVTELMQSLAQGFSEHKGSLESQKQSGGDPDTEELRQALQRYRLFFDRPLST